MKNNFINSPACLAQIQNLIAVTSGNKLTDVTPQANLEEDIGLNLKVDLPEIILAVNHEFRAEGLDLDPGEVIEELEASEPTVLELARIVQETRELG